NIVLTEAVTNDFIVQTNKTLILTAPTGWRFNAGVGSASAARISGASGGSELSVSGITVTPSNVTVTMTANAIGQINSLTIANIQVQAIEGGNLPAAGNVLRTA